MLNQDLKEFIESLNANEVRYLVIGGYALAMHGHPRFTKDIDIWLDCDQSNAERVLKAIADFGFGSLELSASDFSEPNQLIQLGYPPNRIDLLTSADGVEFETCYSARIDTVVDGVPITFIGVEGLKANKRATGRAQDIADLEALEGSDESTETH